jgi:hypothetical protein
MMTVRGLFRVEFEAKNQEKEHITI